MAQPPKQSYQLNPVFTQSLAAESKFESSVSDCHSFATFEGKLCALRLQLGSDLADKIAINEKSETRKDVIASVGRDFKQVASDRKDFVFPLA